VLEPVDQLLQLVVGESGKVGKRFHKPFADECGLQ